MPLLRISFLTLFLLPLLFHSVFRFVLFPPMSFLFLFLTILSFFNFLLREMVLPRGSAFFVFNELLRSRRLTRTSTTIAMENLSAMIFRLLLITRRVVILATLL